MLKRTNWPIVSVPSITSRPPTYSTAATASVGRKIRLGRNFASTNACCSDVSRSATARVLKRSSTSSSRPKACTIWIPTTASSEASVTSPFRSCTRREIGITMCANSHASQAISGIARKLISASCQFTTRSTIATPTIISMLWIPCTIPQPMK